MVKIQFYLRQKCGNLYLGTAFDFMQAMKKILFGFVIIFFAFAKTLVAQTTFPKAQDLIGTYTVVHDDGLDIEGNHSSWQLIISSDGCFAYHFFRKIKEEDEEYFNGKGRWKLDKKTVTFTAKADDITEEYTLDLNKSKARFWSPSPRNKKLKNELPYLLFYESSYKSVKNLKLVKIDG